ncbi:hypothetical protein [Gordonia terrae]|uniref:hypothetical protein n=1 Tax=Gordonia terrae TaxID=2055 RepID=UPI00118030AC|nr:hypothetical protein [Gordonia terrae]
MIPPLSERISRLVTFGHSRHEPALTDRQIADKVSTAVNAPVPEDLIRGLREGTEKAVPTDLVAPLAAVFGLFDIAYLAPEHASLSSDEVDRILLMHERLELLSEARDLGVQHIATRDVDQDPQLISKLKAALNAMTKKNSPDAN